MVRPLTWLLAAAVTAGCLSGAHAYLRLSDDYRMPREFADASTYLELEDAWLRHAPLGLEGGIAAILEDPAVGAARLAYDASRSATPGRPGRHAEQTWEELYRQGDRIPFRVRWRFNKHFHRQATLEPGSGWTFTLEDNSGQKLAPAEIGPLETLRDKADWVGEFRIWFPRRSIDGRLLITNHTRSLLLSVAGIPGDATLSWRFLPLLEARD